MSGQPWPANWVWQLVWHKKRATSGLDNSTLQSFEERTIALDSARPIDRRVVAAAIAALSVGWQISEKWLERTFGLGELDEATLADHFSLLCGYMAELALPAPGKPAEEQAAPA